MNTDLRTVRNKLNVHNTLTGFIGISVFVFIIIIIVGAVKRNSGNYVIIAIRYLPRLSHIFNTRSLVIYYILITYNNIIFNVNHVRHYRLYRHHDVQSINYTESFIVIPRLPWESY